MSMSTNDGVTWLRRGKDQVSNEALRSVHTTHNFIVFVNQGMEAGCQARLGYVCMVIDRAWRQQTSGQNNVAWNQAN